VLLAVAVAESALVRDLNAIFSASDSAERSVAAQAFTADAAKVAAIPGLKAAAPNGPFVARLLAFAAGALATANPAPPVAT
jgi:hypothetical protein